MKKKLERLCTIVWRGRASGHGLARVVSLTLKKEL
jgi:hypothetical protein